MVGKTISHYKSLSKLDEGRRGVVFTMEDTVLAYLCQECQIHGIGARSIQGNLRTLRVQRNSLNQVIEEKVDSLLSR